MFGSFLALCYKEKFVSNLQVNTNFNSTHLADREVELSPALFALEAIHRGQDGAQSTSRFKVHEETHLRITKMFTNRGIFSKHYENFTGSLVVIVGSWAFLPNFDSWYWINCTTSCERDSFVGGSVWTYWKKWNHRLISRKTRKPQQHNGDIFSYFSNSLFCDAFAATIEHFRSLVGIQAIGRSPRWDFHPFSDPDSFYFRSNAQI